MIYKEKKTLNYQNLKTVINATSGIKRCKTHCKNTTFILNNGSHLAESFIATSEV